jgi:hypothetical protein
MKLHWRKIVVDGVEWKYRIGKSNVAFRTEGRTSTAPFTEVTQMSWTDIERAQWKRYFHITPKQIASWLRYALDNSKRAL